MTQTRKRRVGMSMQLVRRNRGFFKEAGIDGTYVAPADGDS